MNWLLRVLRRRRVEAEMSEEMEFHRQARAADLMARGMPPAEASRTARLEFGSAEAYREESRAALGLRLLDELRADLRFALRGLRSNPGFALATIAILGLAIGVNAAFFTLYANYAMRPLPIRGVERHFQVSGVQPDGARTTGFTLAEMAAFAESSRNEIEGLYTVDTLQALVLAPSQRQSLVSSVSGGYFRLLGGNAAIGRTIGESEEREAVAVLSHSGWQRLFPGAANPVGQTIRVKSTAYTVIGAMPPGFTGTAPIVPDFWIGAGMQDALRGEPPTPDRRDEVYAMLASGSPVERARAALSSAASRFARPATGRIERIELRPQRSYFSGDGETTLVGALVFAAFFTVLLIACANLANLFLGRAAARAHEIAMRLSLGASRWRIIRQLLTESTLTALIGAAVGLALALLCVQRAQDWAVSISGIAAGMQMTSVQADWRVLLFSTILGALAGVAFGLLPALEITAPDLARTAKREHSAFAGRIRPRRMRDFLIAGQVAASLVLLITGGIFVRTIQRIESTPAGYDLDRVFDLWLDRPTPAMIAEIERQRGVAGVTAVERVPLYGHLSRLRAATADGRTESLFFNRVDSRYFETLDLKVEGRGFTRAETAVRAKVAVISRATAKRLWPASAPLGQSFRVVDLSAADEYRVVGVVPDVVSAYLFQGADPSMVYLPAEAGQPGIGNAMVRIAGPAGPVAEALRRLCASRDDATGCEPTSLRSVSALQRLPFRIAAGASGALGAAALLLAAVGLFSVTSYTVTQRRREIGVRVALGASPGRVMRGIASEAGRCVLVGVAAGLPLCLALSKLAASSMLRVQTFDPVAYAAAPLLLAAIAAAACAIPARRAARLDPMACLREE